MPNYITHGLVHKKETTSDQNAKGENIFESGAHRETLHYQQCLKTKASSAPVPGLLAVQ